MSDAEELLALHLKAHQIPYEREVTFAKPRRWRADFRVAPDLLIEVEGGTFVGGRHTRGTGFAKDCEKYNAATVLGYRVLRFTPAMVKSSEAIDLIKQAIGA